MKRKFLSILLSLAMVLTMIPFATMTAFADTPTNIEALLEQYNTNNPIPTTEDGAWVGTGDITGAILYITNNSLHFCKGEFTSSLSLTAPLTSIDGGYTSGNNDEGLITFSIQENKLKSITYTGTGSFVVAELVGKYEPPTGDDDDDDKPNWSKLAKGVAIAAGITAATAGTIHAVKAMNKYADAKAAEKAAKEAEEAAKRAAEAEAARLAELEAAKALVEATNPVQNKLAVTEKGSIKISFDAVDLEGFRGYEIERATDKAFTKNVKTYNTENLTLTNSKNLKKGTRYFYRVRAKVELADGSIAFTAWSNVRYTKATKTR